MLHPMHRDDLATPAIVPRLLRFRDAPRYLGMDRNRFNAGRALGDAEGVTRSSQW